MEVKTYNSNRRRVRANPQVRELAATVQLSHRDFIQPLFLDQSIRNRTPINSLNHISSETVESLLKQIESDIEEGINKFLLFPVPVTRSEKNFDFSFVLNALKKINSTFGNNAWIAADVCLCSYTSHGHCGILNKERTKVLNHETVNVLADYSMQLAQAGAQCIAPSDMMDGRIGAIRMQLDKNGLDDISIMSYSCKFSSQFYGPFRDACRSAPGANSELHDRKTYQVSPFNPKDALLAAFRDIEEGADILMVKPALPYLDIIFQLKQKSQLPVAAYHVSGEYQAIELLAENNLLERHKGHLEIWTSLKRAGADMIISYASRNARNWIEKNEY